MADEGIDERQRVIETSENWSQAIVSNDAERIGHFMTDDWMIVSESGVSPRNRFLGFVRSGELTHSVMERAGDADVWIHGDIAVLTARVISTAHYGGGQ